MANLALARRWLLAADGKLRLSGRNSQEMAVFNQNVDLTPIKSKLSADDQIIKLAP
ncbi:MAG: hypothetical protein IPL05_13680 [Betaproteobacteria bacterium]|nr:hypothetical protein [Betaproteobacteria bacterium]